MYRKTYAIINNDILESNVKNIISKFDYKYYIGVVKNNAYNHGIHIIPSLLKAGINYLAVSSLDEALEIRKYYKDIPILILEPIDIDCVLEASKNNITISVENIDYIKELESIKFPNILKIHLIIDSGMNRLGFKDKESINEAYKLINDNKNLYLEGIFTHFATSGFLDKYYDKQVSEVYKLLESIDLTKIPIIHFNRSVTLLRHKKHKYTTGTRLGILMYGFSFPFKYSDNFKDYLRKKKRNYYLKKYDISESIFENDLDVKPSFLLYSKVISIREVHKGDIVGYDGTYVCDSDFLVATICIGYADGVNKHYKYVAINNKKYEIISDCMDMLMVKVDESVKVNDEVEIFGNLISIDEVCKNLKTNPYHLFNMITNRVVRIHITKTNKKEIKY